jgi:hypothetical protein
MNMHRGLIKLALVAGGALSAALTCAADPAPEIPKTRLELWLSAGSVEPAGGVVTRLDDLRGNGNNARRDPPAAALDANPALAKDPSAANPSCASPAPTSPLPSTNSPTSAPPSGW